MTTQRPACGNADTSNALWVVLNYATKAAAWTDSHRTNTWPACKNVESPSVAAQELRRELREVGLS